jgi:hypothetical protein
MFFILCLMSTLFVSNSLHKVYAPVKGGGGLPKEPMKGIKRGTDELAKRSLESNDKQNKIIAERAMGKDPGIQSNVFSKIPGADIPERTDTSEVRLKKIEGLLHDLDMATRSLDPQTEKKTWANAYDFGHATFRPLIDKIEVHFLAGFFNFAFIK